MLYKESIASACITENVRRFQQAASTPFLQPPLRDLLDPLATNACAHHIRNGCFTALIGLDRYTVQVLQELAQPVAAQHHPIFLTLAMDEYKWRWRRAREYTATGRSGLHFGHFQAMLDKQDLALWDLRMIEMPFRYGFVPKRWCQGVDVALQKNQETTEWKHFAP